MNQTSAFTLLRFQFRKLGDLRFISHHDLMRLVERLLRRAALPFRSTEGFHPKPKITFASALSLGIIGLAEILDIEFAGQHDPQDVLQKMQAHSPSPEFQIVSVQPLAARKPAQVVSMTYRFGAVPDVRWPQISGRMQQMMQEAEVWVERSKVRAQASLPQAEGEERLDQLPPMQTEKRSSTKATKRFNLRSSLAQLSRAERFLDMVFQVTPSGTARPEEVLHLLGLHDLFLNGQADLIRTHLQLKEDADAHVPVAEATDTAFCVEAASP